MRFYKMIVLVVSCLAPALLFAQQSSSSTSNGNTTSDDSTNGSGVLVALLNILDSRKVAGIVVYDDLDHDLLSKFNCRDEYNRTSIGTQGAEKGIEDRGLKAYCENGVVIQYAGRSHYVKGSHFRYMLNIFWSPLSDRCFRADEALRLLKNYGWIAGYTAGAYPNTETLISKFNDVSFSISWVPQENPNSLRGVDASLACIRSVVI